MHTKKIGLLAAAVIAAGSAATPAFAVSDNVPFFGSVGGLVCALSPAFPGRLDTAPGDLTVLSSQRGSGSAGTITVTSVGTDFKLTVEAPTDWTADPSDFGGTAPPPTVFTTTYTGTGDTTLTGSNIGGSVPTEHPLNNGQTSLTVNLEGDADSNDFTAGLYRADVLVTCEI